MEGVSTSMYKGLRGYWRRRGYEKLSGSGRLTELRSGGKRRARRIRIKIKMGRKLKLSILRMRRMPSPKKLLVWLRDAYVKLMLGFANSGMFSTGYGGPMCDYGSGSFGKGPLKEYDEKMIVEIYKSLMVAQGQLVARDAAKFGSEIVSRRWQIAERGVASGQAGVREVKRTDCNGVVSTEARNSCVALRERESTVRLPASASTQWDLTTSQGWGSMIDSTWYHAIGLTSQLVYTNVPGLEKPELF